MPTPTGSLTDLVAELGSADTTAEEVNAAFKEAAEGSSRREFFTTAKMPLVLQDIVGDPHSSIYDSRRSPPSYRAETS